MKRITFIFALLLLIGCKQERKAPEDSSQTVVGGTESEKEAMVIKQNYAVVFQWATRDEAKVRAHSQAQNDQLLELWKNNTVENVYYDAKAQYDSFSYFPNITFTLKAENEAAAKEILDDLVVVKQGISTYSLHPVGMLWLKRDSKKIEERGMTHSYVTVWNTDKKPDAIITKKQNDAILDLWNQGAIENVYFDIEGTQKQNQKTDFVFFVNANSEKEAKTLINKLPFVEQRIASYQLYPVGVFWMGIQGE